MKGGSGRPTDDSSIGRSPSLALISAGRLVELNLDQAQAIFSPTYLPMLMTHLREKMNKTQSQRRPLASFFLQWFVKVEPQRVAKKWGEKNG